MNKLLQSARNLWRHHFYKPATYQQAIAFAYETRDTTVLYKRLKAANKRFGTGLFNAQGDSLVKEASRVNPPPYTDHIKEFFTDAGIEALRQGEKEAHQFYAPNVLLHEEEKSTPASRLMALMQEQRLAEENAKFHEKINRARLQGIASR
jgi:hypothetical protein